MAADFRQVAGRFVLDDVDIADLFFHRSNATSLMQSSPPTGFRDLQRCPGCELVTPALIASWQQVTAMEEDRLVLRGERCAVLGEGGAEQLRHSGSTYAYVLRAHSRPGDGFEDFVRHNHGDTTFLSLQSFPTNNEALPTVFRGEQRMRLCGKTTEYRHGRKRGMVSTCWNESRVLRVSPRISRRLYPEPINAAKQLAGVLCQTTTGFGWHHDAPNPTMWARSGASGDWWWHLIRTLDPQPSEDQRRKVVETVRRQQCVEVQHACIEAEQVVVHGAAALMQTSQRRLLRLLNRTMDVTEAFRDLRPWYRNTVVTAASPSTALSYLPLAVSAQVVAARSESPRRWFLRHSALPASEFIATSQTHPPLVFFTSFVENLGELFVRAIPFVFALTQQHIGSQGIPQPMLHSNSRLHHRIMPAMLPARFYALFDAFSAHGVEPLALYPNASLHEPMDLLHARAGAANYDAYRRRSFQFYASRQPERCYERIRVCDLFSRTDMLQLPSFRRLQAMLRPWETMQAILRHHGQHDPEAHTRRLLACGDGQLSPAHTCPLRIRFVLRQRRRFLLDVSSLVRKCNAWVPTSLPGLKVHCGTVSFSRHAVHHPIADVDVLVSPHGADVVNALKLHAGASLVEVMPVLTKLPNQDCTVCHGVLGDYMMAFRAEPQLHHYRLFTDQSEYSVRAGGHVYDSSLRLPWGALQSVLEDIVTHGATSRN